MTFITLLSTYAMFLFIITISRRFLTYKGLTILLIINNFFLLLFCSTQWQSFVLNSCSEYFSLKLNPNTWLGVAYDLSFKISNLSFLFIFLVVIIGFSTNIYILNYFKYEEREEEFILLINWFILSMILLVCGNNFFTLILGWELIGLTSFLLINFWKFKITTLSCSFKAFTFNKFSDLLLLISFCVLWNNYQINNIDTLLLVIDYCSLYDNNLIIFSAISLLICCSVKSAQLFGHLWLPDSMEAPVPASSLIHSATLVSAGIFLILKFQSLYVTANLLNFLFILGGITAFYGGIVAASQTDVKKLLAYSTVSHCGFIIASIPFNNITVSIVYLYLHGLYKAVTFFCVGSLIKYNGSQDTRMMGFSKSQLINTVTLILVSCNLGGLPFFCGYLYKQLFINSLVYTNFSFIGFGFCILGMLTSPVYVYKLNYYGSFDFRKGLIQSVFIKLQTYSNNLLKTFSYFTHTKLIAFWIIFFYSVCFFIITKYYILTNYFFFNITPCIDSNTLPFLTNILTNKSYLIKYYYNFFLLVIIVLTLAKNRTSYFFLDKLNLYYSILSLTVFLNFYFYILSFIM